MACKRSAVRSRVAPPDKSIVYRSPGLRGPPRGTPDGTLSGPTAMRLFRRVDSHVIRAPTHFAVIPSSQQAAARCPRAAESAGKPRSRGNPPPEPPAKPDDRPVKKNRTRTALNRTNLARRLHGRSTPAAARVRLPAQAGTPAHNGDVSPLGRTGALSIARATTSASSICGFCYFPPLGTIFWARSRWRGIEEAWRHSCDTGPRGWLSHGGGSSSCRARVPFVKRPAPSSNYCALQPADISHVRRRRG